MNNCTHEIEQREPGVNNIGFRKNSDGYYEPVASCKHCEKALTPDQILSLVQKQKR